MHKKSIAFAFLLLGALLVETARPIVANLLASEPYYNVEKESVKVKPDTVEIKYTFEKGEDCRLISFAVEGLLAGVPRYLQYKDLNGVPKDFDRPPGEQVLHIEVLTDGQPYETVRLRTRHDCGGKLVNKEFTSVDLYEYEK